MKSSQLNNSIGPVQAKRALTLLIMSTVNLSPVLSVSDTRKTFQMFSFIQKTMNQKTPTYVLCFAV